MAGIVTPPRLLGKRKVGIDVEDVRSGERRPLAECSGDTDGPSTGAWSFHAAALAWGAAVLQTATPCDVLLIDELGPLELLQGEGWVSALDVLRGSAYRLAVAVVRPELEARLRHLLGAQRVDHKPLDAGHSERSEESHGEMLHSVPWPAARQGRQHDTGFLHGQPPQLMTLAVTRENQDILLGQIAALLGDEA